MEICLGAKKAGLTNLVIAVRGRDKIYTDYYRNLVDDIILIDSFSQLTDEKTVSILKEKNCIFIPHRYCQVYCNLELLEKMFPIPIFGNKYLLKYEERSGIYNQYKLMYEAQIPYPLRFNDPLDIDRLVIVKVKEAQRYYERAFYYARNYSEYKKNTQKMIKTGKIKEKDMKEAVIEEYLVGAQVNFNFFYSPITHNIQLLGTDTRRQTNIDGLIRLPAGTQQDLADDINPSYIESGHIAVTVKESLLANAFHLAERLIDSTQTYVPPGIIGPFALQTAVIPGPPKEKIVTYDLSFRIPGSPGSIFTPYSQYHFGEPVSFGTRICMEIMEAVKIGRLDKITT